MKHLIIKLVFILLMTLGMYSLQAQEVISTAGGDAISNEGSVSYSIGQLVYTTYEGPDGSVAQGVQQPYEISIIVGLDEAKGIELTCSAFPNPTTDMLTLKVENYDLDDLTYYLISMNGNLMVSQKIISQETSIPMNNYLRGTYILKIVSRNTEAKSFSIIKN